MQAGYPVLLVGQGIDERTGVLRVDDRDHKLHPGGTIPSRSGYVGAPRSASTSSRSHRASARQPERASPTSTGTSRRKVRSGTRVPTATAVTSRIAWSDTPCPYP